MLHKIRPLALVFSLVFSFVFLGVAQAAPAKKGAAKPEPKVEAVTEVVLSHQLTEKNAERLSVLVEQFNAQQKSVSVRLVQAEANGKPTLLNLATSGTVANFLADKSRFKPLHQLMRENREKLPSDISSDLLVGEKAGKLMALPIAFSTPVLFFNKGMFRQAGLDPDKPPRTWRELQDAAGALIEKGMYCPYTSSWPVWVHIDNVSSVSGVPVVDGKGNLVFNGLIQVKHLAMLSTWHEAGYFQTFGRTNEADAHFFKGECAMLTTDSSAHSFLRDAPGIELGVAPLPNHADVYGGGQKHTLAGGASIWVGAGFKAQEYKAAARFIGFLLTPEIQLELVRSGGFLPLTTAARKASKSALLKDEEQLLDVASTSLQGKGASNSLRVSNLDPVRIILEEELERLWVKEKPAKEVLDVAVSRGNAVLSAKPALKKAVSF